MASVSAPPVRAENENSGRIICDYTNDNLKRLEIVWSKVSARSLSDIPVTVRYRERWSWLKTKGFMSVNSINTRLGLETIYYVKSVGGNFYDFHFIRLREVHSDSASIYSGVFVDHWGVKNQVRCR
jgi:hypothetical protein